MNQKLGRMILLIIDVLIVLFVVVFAAFFENSPWTPILIVAGLFAVKISLSIIRHKFWYCPHCCQDLPWRGAYGMKYCPHCGEKLDL